MGNSRLQWQGYYFQQYDQVFSKEPYGGDFNYTWSLTAITKLSCLLGCAGYLAVFLGVLFMALAALFLFFFRNQIGPLFVDDGRVGGEVAGVAPICAAYQMPDGVYGVASGVLRCKTASC